MKKIFITGIDTEIGKTIVTGNLAKYLLSTGIKVTTMKPVQTGCEGIAEDILTHRKIMGVELDRFDIAGVTAPVVFKFPASPHLAAEMEGKNVDLNLIDNSMKTLEKEFECLLIEGAGGIYVPLTREYTTLDFVKDRNIPVIIVSSPRLGSINHTMMTVDILTGRKVKILALIYNMYPPEKEPIATDSINVIRHFSLKMGMSFPIYTNPFIQNSSETVVLFSGLEKILS